MLLAVILAATSFPVGAAITGPLPPAVMMLLRFILAALCFLPLVIYKNRWAFFKREQQPGYILLGLSPAVFFWCMFESLRYTTVLNTGALYTAIPAATAVWAFLLNGESTSRNRASGLLLGTIGALWIVFRGDTRSILSLAFNYGDLIFLTGCIFLAAYNPLVKRIYKNEPMEIMTFWVMVYAAVWLFIAAGSSFWQTDYQAVAPNIYWGIGYLAVFTTLVTFFLVQFSTVRIGPTPVAAYGLLTPLFVIFISIGLGMDDFDPVLLPGILLIGLSLLLIQSQKTAPK